MNTPRPPLDNRYPVALPLNQPADIDLCTLLSAAIWDISGVDIVTIQRSIDAAAWPVSGEVTVQVSNDARYWAAPPAGSTSYTSAGISDRIDVGGYRFLRIVVSTAGSGTAPINATFFLHGRARPIVGTI